MYHRYVKTKPAHAQQENVIRAMIDTPMMGSVDPIFPLKAVEVMYRSNRTKLLDKLRIVQN